MDFAIIRRRFPISYIACIVVSLNILSTCILGSYGVIRSNVHSDGKTGVVHLGAGGSVHLNDGQYAIRAIEGLIWYDLDADGIRSPQEPGLEYGEIEVYHSHHPLPTSTIHSGTDGKFIGTVEPGTCYLVMHCPSGGFRRSPRLMELSAGDASRSRVVSMVDEKSGESIVFSLQSPSALPAGDLSLVTPFISLGCYKLARIQVRAFLDSDMSGIHEAWKPAVLQARVSIRRADDTIAWRDTVTGPSGVVVFDDLVPGSYVLTFSHTDTSYRRSATHCHAECGPNTRVGYDKEVPCHRDAECSVASMSKDAVEISWMATIISDETFVIDQGLYTLGTISGIVFEDLDADGIQDPNEPYLPFVRVLLYREGDIFVTETTSHEDGSYMFPQLEPASYYVVFQRHSVDHQHSVVEEAADYVKNM